MDGVFTADPRIVPAARQLAAITYDEMLEMAASGAKVLHLRCVEYASATACRSTYGRRFSQRPGTIVAASWADAIEASEQETTMEQPIISGVAHDRSEAKITVVGVPDVVGAAARIFEKVADAGANLDMIVQNVSAAGTGRTDISFTLPAGRRAASPGRAAGDRRAVGVENVQYDDQIGKVSLVGAGMRTHPGVSARLFGALADAGVNIEMISTSEIRMSVVVQADDVDRAVAAIHTAFDLDATDIEAVVYGGTGR